jgi:hypothetical protein
MSFEHTPEYTFGIVMVARTQLAWSGWTHPAKLAADADCPYHHAEAALDMLCDHGEARYDDVTHTYVDPTCDLALDDPDYDGTRWAQEEEELLQVLGNEPLTLRKQGWAIRFIRKDGGEWKVQGYEPGEGTSTWMMRYPDPLPSFGAQVNGLRVHGQAWLNARIEDAARRRKLAPRRARAH